VRALEALAVSALARVEVPAALWRKHHIGELDSRQARVLTHAFEADFSGTAEEPERFAVIAAATRVLERASGIVATHALRAHDAVQLASGLAARDADPTCETFACFDETLRTAAAANGFVLLPG
jgi:predicted nucleic acid-binding protein